MTGTIHSTGGSDRITRMAFSMKVRLFGFLLAAAIGAATIVWMERGMWHKVEELEREIAAVESERFYTGVYWRTTFRHINDALLRYYLHGNEGDREEFRNMALEFEQQIAKAKSALASPAEAALFVNIETAFGSYLSECAILLAGKAHTFPGEKFEQIYEKVHKSSQMFLSLCTELVAAQRRTLMGFLGDLQETAESFRRFTQMSLVFSLFIATCLFILIYRGMVAPLREELSQSQATIQRQEKLASLGVLAAGVAHEIRNPLTAIKFRLFSLTRSTPSLSDNEDATLIDSELNRLDRIVSEFLQFARPSDPDLARVSVDRLLEGVQDLLKPQLEKSAIQLRLEPGPAFWVFADTQQMRQVLINLVQNAADSIGRNGTILLRAGAERRFLGNRLRPAVILQVADTGAGIPPEVQRRMFDPFFTTKEGGTGLGLAIAARIVEKHGGELRYETQRGHGTTFSIILPRAEEDEA